MTSPSMSGWPEWRFVAVGRMPTSEDWPITWPLNFPPAKKRIGERVVSTAAGVQQGRTTEFTEAYDHGFV